MSNVTFRNLDSDLALGILGRVSVAVIRERPKNIRA